MKKNAFSTRWLSAVLCLVLMAAMALTMTGCTDGNATTTTTTAATTTTTVVTTTTTAGPTELGRGEMSFLFNVTDVEGNVTEFKILTDETMVGTALQNLDLIDGIVESYGLYVKEVNGITADYDKDGTYWAFYINGEYATAGVDTTPITDGATYEFKVQK